MVHMFYSARPPSGENTVVRKEVEALTPCRPRRASRLFAVSSSRHAHVRIVRACSIHLTGQPRLSPMRPTTERPTAAVLFAMPCQAIYPTLPCPRLGQPSTSERMLRKVRCLETADYSVLAWSDSSAHRLGP